MDEIESYILLARQLIASGLRPENVRMILLRSGMPEEKCFYAFVAAAKLAAASGET